MSTEGSAALAVVHQATPIAVGATIRFAPDQVKLILDTCCGGAPPHEAQALIRIAEARGLNPLTGDCYFVKRWDSAKRCDVWAVQASIDSFRSKAEETGLYGGQDEPEFEYDAKGALVLARVRIYRKDWPRPMVAVARYSEYVQTTREGAPTRFWKQMAHNQLAKCAEALALRKAFPKVLGGIHTRDEMQQAENELPPHDPETGEVRDAGPGVAAAAAVNPMVARFDLRRAELMAAPDLDAFHKLWKRIQADGKAARISLEHGVQLRGLAEARKLALEGSAEAARKAEQDRALDVGADPGGLGPGQQPARVQDTPSGRTTFDASRGADGEPPDDETSGIDRL